MESILPTLLKERRKRWTLGGFGLSETISEESLEANKIKIEKPIMVIVGNPPYKGKSGNRSDWIMKLMEDYKKEPGVKKN